MQFLELWLNELGLASQVWHPVIALAIFLTGAVIAFLFHKVIYPIVIRFTNFTPTNLDVSLVRAFRRPLTLGILMAGLYLALVLSFDFTPAVRHAIDRIAGLVALALGIIAASGLVSALFSWYYDEVAPHTPTTLDDRIMPMLRRIATGLVYAMGGLLVLDLLNVNISPILASLGLGGLAVALALQPTLSNLFAGTYVMTEGVVSQGDYIELESGVAGYVIDVGWRSTRLRTWTNNLVVVPNSRFAETIITNFQGPIPAVNIYLTCGVSFDSDLFLVEQVCREEMDKLLESDPRAVKDYGAYFAYESFDDSNITFLSLHPGPRPHRQLRGPVGAHPHGPPAFPGREHRNQLPHAYHKLRRQPRSRCRCPGCLAASARRDPRSPRGTRAEGGPGLQRRPRRRRRRPGRPRLWLVVQLL